MSAAILSLPTLIPDSATVIAAAQQAAASHLHLVIDSDGQTKLTPFLLPGMQKIVVRVKNMEGKAS